MVVTCRLHGLIILLGFDCLKLPIKCFTMMESLDDFVDPMETSHKEETCNLREEETGEQSSEMDLSMQDPGSASEESTDDYKKTDNMLTSVQVQNEEASHSTNTGTKANESSVSSITQSLFHQEDMKYQEPNQHKVQNQNVPDLQRENTTFPTQDATSIEGQRNQEVSENDDIEDGSTCILEGKCDDSQIEEESKEDHHADKVDADEDPKLIECTTISHSMPIETVPQSLEDNHKMEEIVSPNSTDKINLDVNVAQEYEVASGQNKENENKLEIDDEQVKEDQNSRQFHIKTNSNKVSDQSEFPGLDTQVHVDVDKSVKEDVEKISIVTPNTEEHDEQPASDKLMSGSPLHMVHENKLSTETSSHSIADIDMDNDSETEKQLIMEDVASLHDTLSKSPIPLSKSGSAEKRGKVSSKGFSLGNIVSRLKIKVESKQEEVDTTEMKKDSGDAVIEKTQSKRSEQKQQGKQMRAAAHAAMMMFQDGDDDEEEDGEDHKDDDNQPEGAKDMKIYATDTMDELLGLYGYDKVENSQTEHLQLSTGLSQSKTPITGKASTLKPNQKQPQGHKPTEGDTGLVITNVTSMAPVKKTGDEFAQDGTKLKTEYCVECNLPVDNAVMLKIGLRNFCSQTCIANYQSRQTTVCDYCSGMITQTAKDKFVRDTQEGQKRFCSQTCTEEFSKRVRNCNTCGKEISRASEGIFAPVGSDGKFVDFCQQECVDNYGKKMDTSSKGTNKLEVGQPRYWAQDTFFVCAICNNYAKAKHVISLQGKLNGLCSADCFTQFKEKNQLQFSLCSQCSALCSNQKMMRSIEIEGKLHRFCSMRCFKMKLKRSMNTIACAACKTPSLTQNMIEEWNGTELVRFFCSTVCLGKRDAIPFASSNEKNVSVVKTLTSVSSAQTVPSLPHKQHKPQQIQQSNQSSSTRSSASGNKCDHCCKQQRPQYHLTMSDNSIRNFCSYGCVIAFQAQFNVPPVTLPQETLQLTCSQCHRGFSNKPLPLDFKSVVNVFCTQNCLDEFKRVNSVVVECDYCHLEKILHERIYFSGQARSFCSEGCKLLFKQQFAQRLGLRCTVCDYCAQTCRSRVERMYGNHKKKFCSMACKSQYDKWLSKGAKCDGCKCTGRKLAESFVWRGEMKRVCNQHCLLLFYTQQNIPNMNTQTQSTIPAIQLTQIANKTPTPVITNVVSLAPGQPPPQQQQQQQQQAVPPTNNTQFTQKVVPTVIKKCHKQTQITTAPPKVLPPPAPPTPLPPAPKMVKNKITLVKPFTQTKSISCRPLTSCKETMTDEVHPMLIPVPVPIYVPVPMHMYTSPIPHPISLPVPIPVPIFIPVAHTNADQLLASIQEISQKIPSDPLEAELLMLADAIASDSGGKGGQVSQPKDIDMPAVSSLQALDENADVRSNAMVDTEEVLPSELLADNILKMAADIAHVLKDEPHIDLQDDLDSLLVVEEPKVDAMPRTTRSKSGKTPSRRGRSRGSKRTCVEEPSVFEVAESLQDVKRSKAESRTTIGVNAYRYFISQKKESLAGKELKGLTLNSNLLEVSSEELGYILCLMCKESAQPDGTQYSPDILHLIFLSIQHHLSDNGRPENIFTDQLYGRFTDLLHDEIKDWVIDRHPVSNVILNTSINEETLWNAKQLGAHSPYILLSTLIYFNAKQFQLKTLDHHKRLAFCRIQKHIRKMGTSRSMFLRYYPADRKKALTEPATKKRCRDPDLDSVRLEQSENTENPLRCPVKLYEFYLSKCPDSIKNHTELFYLVPERSCVPDSPVWYSSSPLGDHDMNKILTRILMVTDIHNTWDEMNEDGDD